MTAVKICGITRVEDGLAAARWGAGAVGFVFASSRRQVDPKLAGMVARELPPFISRVGVFVDASTAEILQTAELVGLDVIQLHGQEAPEAAALLQRAGLRVLKTFRVRAPEDVRAAASYPADGVLLDAYHPHHAGGTGSSFPWEWLQELSDLRFAALAGGLRPDNVRSALTLARPDAVDVSSGVEDAPGIKSESLIRRFISEVRRFDLESTADPS